MFVIRHSTRHPGHHYKWPPAFDSLPNFPNYRLPPCNYSRLPADLLTSFCHLHPWTQGTLKQNTTELHTGCQGPLSEVPWVLRVVHALGTLRKRLNWRGKESLGKKKNRTQLDSAVKRRTNLESSSEAASIGDAEPGERSLQDNKESAWCNFRSLSGTS